MCQNFTSLGQIVYSTICPTLVSEFSCSVIEKHGMSGQTKQTLGGHKKWMLHIAILPLFRAKCEQMCERFLTLCTRSCSCFLKFTFLRRERKCSHRNLSVSGQIDPVSTEFVQVFRSFQLTPSFHWIHITDVRCVVCMQRKEYARLVCHVQYCLNLRCTVTQFEGLWRGLNLYHGQVLHECSTLLHMTTPDSKRSASKETSSIDWQIHLYLDSFIQSRSWLLAFLLTPKMNYKSLLSSDISLINTWK